MYKLVLIRHGESTWNLENRFTGWTDVDLTPTGVDQAKAAGRLLKAEGLCIDQEGYIQEADDHFHTMGVRRNIRWSDAA